MSIQLMAISHEFAPLASSTVDDFETAQMVAEAAFESLPECAYIEMTVTYDADEFQFRVDVITRAELAEGI